MVRLHTNLGTITLDLDAEKAPATVENFLTYVNSGFYSNTLFHRVIDGFMIQGGGFERGMKQKPVRTPIKNEAANGLKNEAYTVAMARTPDPDSATAQFFINVADNDFLDYRAPTAKEYGYCVSRAWWKARTSWIRSRKSRPPPAACTATCRWKTSSSPRRR